MTLLNVGFVNKFITHMMSNIHPNQCFRCIDGYWRGGRHAEIVVGGVSAYLSPFNILGLPIRKSSNRCAYDLCGAMITDVGVRSVGGIHPCAPTDLNHFVLSNKPMTEKRVVALRNDVKLCLLCLL